jgi:WD40 repeat protein
MRRWLLRGDEGSPAGAGGGGASESEGANLGGSSIFSEEREVEELLPSHGGQVVALTSTKDGLLVSGAHDGTLRVWDVLAPEAGGGPKCLYGFGGYKVWLGSVCTDGRRLLADGSDNKILVHDFDPGEEMGAVGSS